MAIVIAAVLHLRIGALAIGLRAPGSSCGAAPFYDPLEPSWSAAPCEARPLACQSQGGDQPGICRRVAIKSVPSQGAGEPGEAVEVSIGRLLTEICCVELMPKGSGRSSKTAEMTDFPDSLRWAGRAAALEELSNRPDESKRGLFVGNDELGDDIVLALARQMLLQPRVELLAKGKIGLGGVDDIGARIGIGLGWIGPDQRLREPVDRRAGELIASISAAVPRLPCCASDRPRGKAISSSGGMFPPVSSVTNRSTRISSSLAANSVKVIAAMCLGAIPEASRKSDAAGQDRGLARNPPRPPPASCGRSRLRASRRSA